MEVKKRGLERRVKEERLVSIAWQEAFIGGIRDVLINMFVCSSS